MTHPGGTHLKDDVVWTLIYDGLNKYQQKWGIDLVSQMSPWGYNSLDDIARDLFGIALAESEFAPHIMGDEDQVIAGPSVGLWQSSLQHYGDKANDGLNNLQRQTAPHKVLGYTQGDVQQDVNKQVEMAIWTAVNRTKYGATSPSNPNWSQENNGLAFDHPMVPWSVFKQDVPRYNEGLEDFDAFSSTQAPFNPNATGSNFSVSPSGVLTGTAPAAAPAAAPAGSYTPSTSMPGQYQPPVAQPTAPQFQVAPEVTQAELDQDRFDSTALIGRNILQGLPTGEAQMNVNPEVYANLSELDNVNPDLLFGGEFGNQLPTPTMDTIAKSTPMERENWNAAASMFELPDFTDLAGATKRRWSGRKETGSGLMNTAPRPSRPSMGGRALGSVRSGALGTPNRTPTSYRSPNSPSRNKAASIRSGRAGQIRSSSL